MKLGIGGVSRGSVAAVFAIGWLLSFGAGCRPPLPTGVLLLVSDTFRADAIRCDTVPPKTPHLCALADRGATFEQAYSAAPWTIPSAVSILTGRHPTVFSRIAIDSDAKVEDRNAVFYVRDEDRLLSETLRERGFSMAAMIENELMLPANVLRGFDRVPRSQLYSMRRIATKRGPRGELWSRLPSYRAALSSVKFLEGVGADPFMLFYWIMDPHAEYQAPSHLLEPARASARGLAQPLSFYSGLGHKHDPPRGRRKLRDHIDSLDPAERRLLAILYAAEVRSVDERIGAVLAALDSSGRSGDTLVVFTSDHGEGFGEHGLFLHANSLYNELMRVPLLLAGPGIPAGVRIEAPVSHVDLVPTLRDVLGLEPDPRTHGRTLRPLWSGESEPAGLRTPYLVSPVRLRGQEGLVEAPFKLIRRDEGSVELYDLRDDPAERRNVAARHPEIVARLTTRLDRLRAENETQRSENFRAADEVDLDRVTRDTEERLRAIGYIE